MSAKTCKRCQSNRILSVSGKCSDCCSASYQDRETDGYVPSIDVIGGGDYVELDLCLDCGQHQGKFPVSQEEVDEAFPAEEDDEDKQERARWAAQIKDLESQTAQAQADLDKETDKTSKFAKHLASFITENKRAITEIQEYLVTNDD
jgi:hypothetical protein